MHLTDLPLAPGANLLGHLRAFDQDRLGTLRSLGRMNAPVVRARFLKRHIAVVTDPATTHELLVEKARHFEKAPGLRVLLHDLAGEGLFTSEGELWRRQRRLMSPLFHPAQLGSYTLAMNVEANRGLDRIADGATVDLSREMTRVTMGVVASTLLGTDAMTREEADALGDALTISLGFTGEMISSPWIAMQLQLAELAERRSEDPRPRVRRFAQQLAERLREPVMLPGARSPRMQAALARLDVTMQGMITARRGRGEVRRDLLTKLLEARDPDGQGEGMDDKQVRDEAKTLFVAGHETTATALTWALYLLARHPEARARVQAEADACDERGPTSYDGERLAFTTRVFKEALRMYPPLVMMGRRSLDPVTLAGVDFPARSLVFASPYALHYRPDVYPDPDRFDPDRFLPEVEAKRPKSAFLPFGVGPRVCIGNFFALMEGPIILATWMRRAEIDLISRQEVEADRFATLRPKGEVRAVIRKRAP
jgi:cytochrome P450